MKKEVHFEDYEVSTRVQLWVCRHTMFIVETHMFYSIVLIAANLTQFKLEKIQQFAANMINTQGRGGRCFI